MVFRKDLVASLGPFATFLSRIQLKVTIKKGRFDNEGNVSIFF